MNFFEYQDKARLKTNFLVIGFAIAVIGIVLLIDGAYLLLQQWLRNVESPMEYRQDFFAHLDLNIINIIIFLIIMLGALAKYYVLKGGGTAIVKLMNAQPIDRDHPDPAVRQLVDIVDEISIAAGIIAPMIYVMQDEKGINAFVAGYNPNDTVLVVTQGALDNLSRDEMQGVIGHEYSHIFNSDTSINLRLLIILGGLFLVSQIGNIMMRTRSRNAGGIILLGLILYLLGLIGVFFGNVLRAAISRQREALADACSVQYTRDPNGIARALLKIEAQGRTALMQNNHAAEVNHMCFSVARDLSISQLFASHPKLSDRIALLDPTGEIRAAFMQQGQQRKPVIQEAKPTPAMQASTQALVNTIAAGAILTSGAKIVSAVGNPTAHSLSHAETLLHSIPKDIMNLLASTTGTQAILYAIAINMGKSADSSKHQIVLPNDVQQALKQCINSPEVANMPYRAILTYLAIPILKKLEQAAKKEFLKNIFTMLEDNINISKAILLTILNQKLNDDAFAKVKVKYTNFKQLDNETTCIIWHMTQQSDEDLGTLDSTFIKAMLMINPKFAAHLQDFNYIPHDLFKSFMKLRLMAPDIKQQFLSACVTCIMDDGNVNINELELLRAICTCLDCPLPLLHPVPA